MSNFLRSRRLSVSIPLLAAGVAAAALVTVVDVSPAAAVGARLPVSAISASGDDGNVPANAIDGDLATRWSDEGDGVWLKLDLGSNKDLGSVSIAFRNGADRHADFQVQTADAASPSSWTTVVSRRKASGTTTQLETYSFTAVNDRYLRVLGYGNEVNDWTSITEIAVQGPDGGTTPTPPPTSPPPTTPPPTTSPSGEPMPTSAPAGWRRIFSDDFTTAVPLGGFAASSYAAKWDWYPTSYRDTSGNGQYNPAIISVAGGVLTKNLRTSNGTPQVAALQPKLSSTSPYGRVYGRYTVRFRADAVPGYKVAWLQWPDNDNWSQGEIDFPEGDLTGSIEGYNHCPGHPEDNCLAVDTGASMTGWHTATQEWTSGRVTFFLDGRQVATTTSNLPRNSMHWVLQTETQLSGGKPPASAAGKVQIDWVTADVAA